MNFGAVLLSVMAILTVFSLVGLGVMLNAFRVGRQERPVADGRLEEAHELREKIRLYIGPVDPKTRLLNPPGRVAVEFVGAFCGFPGLGWMCSGSMFIGLLLICCGPAFAWGHLPGHPRRLRKAPIQPVYRDRVSTGGGGGLGGSPSLPRGDVGARAQAGGRRRRRAGRVMQAETAQHARSAARSAGAPSWSWGSPSVPW